MPAPVSRTTQSASDVDKSELVPIKYFPIGIQYQQHLSAIFKAEFDANQAVL